MFKLANPDITICIPTYNRSSYLQACLNSVITAIQQGNLGDKVDVLISDNHSTDDTAEIIQPYLQMSDVSISYHCNPVNVGAVNNFIQLTEMSAAQFTYILGDDDKLVPNALEAVVKMMQQFPTAQVYHFKSEQTSFIKSGSGATPYNVWTAAQRFFYSVGNAGTFMFKTADAQEVIKLHKSQLATTCWPQTAIMFSILLKQPDHGNFIASDISLVNSDSHNQNVSYNSWYIAETFCFSLLRVAQFLAHQFKQPAIIGHAKKSIPACRQSIRYYARFLLFVTYYDYPYELAAAEKLTSANRKYLTGSSRAYPLIYGWLLALPVGLKKCLVAVYFFISTPTFKKSIFAKHYEQIAAYQQNKRRIYTEKGKLKEDKERYIY